MDRVDHLKSFRDRFHIPLTDAGKPSIYFCGNSLGLQPKNVRSHIEEELLAWEKLGVEGHFEGRYPWFKYHHFLKDATAQLVGAKPDEVVVMNGLTVNLHLMLTSFYRPTTKRRKIIIEADAFPSDKYAVDSHAQLHGFTPADAIVELTPRAGEHCLRTEDILETITEIGDELTLVMLGTVNYYTGQYFDLQAITKAAHEVGALAGYDCAHAVGNVVMELHDWEVDFAVWCSYKYLNSGPGGVSGVFVHEKHGNNPEIPRLAGWWGNDEATRFEMPRQFVPQQGAAGWQLSNAPVLPMAAHKASLEVFAEAGMKALRRKGDLLTGYLEFLLDDLNQQCEVPAFHVITPKSLKDRGCQLSILTQEKNGKAIFDYISKHGVVADWRNPNVIRVAPVPLYNTFEEVFDFARLLQEAIASRKG